jgi:hypothetical protein
MEWIPADEIVSLEDGLYEVMVDQSFAPVHPMIRSAGLEMKNKYYASLARYKDGRWLNHIFMEKIAYVNPVKLLEAYGDLK